MTDNNIIKERLCISDERTALAVWDEMCRSLFDDGLVNGPHFQEVWQMWMRMLSPELKKRLYPEAQR